MIYGDPTRTDLDIWTTIDPADLPKPKYTAEEVEASFRSSIKDACEYLNKAFAAYHDDFGDLGGNFHVDEMMLDFGERALDHMHTALREIEANK